MFWDTLERVNRLRQQAMNNPEFLQSAKQHEETLQHVEQYFEPKKYRKSNQKRQKTLAISMIKPILVNVLMMSLIS